MLTKVSSLGHKAGAILHSNKTGRTLKHVSHGGHIFYLLGVFLESHYYYGLIAGGLATVIVIKLWIGVEDAED
jgi:hypothetical protein